MGYFFFSSPPPYPPKKTHSLDRNDIYKKVSRTHLLPTETYSLPENSTPLGVWSCPQSIWLGIRPLTFSPVSVHHLYQTSHYTAPIKGGQFYLLDMGAVRINCNGYIMSQMHETSFQLPTCSSIAYHHTSAKLSFCPNSKALRGFAIQQWQYKG